MSEKFRTSRSSAYLKPYHFYKDSKVQEHFAFDCDINNIVRGLTQPLPVRDVLPSTVDELKRFNANQYEEALLVKAESENLFNKLPSNIRSYFDNNPSKLLSFVSDPKNAQKCVELGLATVRNTDISDINKSLQELNSTIDKSITADAVISPEGDKSRS